MNVGKLKAAAISLHQIVITNKPRVQRERGS